MSRRLVVTGYGGALVRSASPEGRLTPSVAGRCKHPLSTDVVAMLSAAKAFCSASSTVTPVSLTRCTALNTCSTTSGARPRLGSSSSSSCGRAMSARAMATICCCPPDRLPAGAWRFSTRAGKRSYARSSSRAVPAGSRRCTNAPRRRFFSTLSSGNSRRPSGHCATPLATLSSGRPVVRLVPFQVALPPAGRCRPLRVRKRVLLPAPFAPSSTTISPRCTLRFRACSAVKGP